MIDMLPGGIFSVQDAFHISVVVKSVTFISFRIVNRCRQCLIRQLFVNKSPLAVNLSCRPSYVSRMTDKPTDLDKYSIQMPYLLFTPYHLM